MADLDHFKVINDLHGHAAGDFVLREVATRLLTGVRAGEEVSRLAGDEFVIVCQEAAQYDLSGLCARVAHILSAPALYRGVLRRVCAAHAHCIRRVCSPRVRHSCWSLRLGGEIRFSFRLDSRSSRAQEVVVDYAMYFVQANGTSRPKVFKLRRITLAANESAHFEGKVSFAQMTTRQHYPGLHRIEVLVNGVAFPLGELQVRT